MKALKIAMVTGSFPMVSETFVVNQIVSLKNLGHHVEVFCFHQSDLSLRNYTHNRIESVNLLDWGQYMPKTFKKRFITILLLLFKAAKAHVLQEILTSACFKKGKLFNTHLFFKTYYLYLFIIEGYDVLHIHFGTNAMELLPQVSNFNKKVVVSFHGYDAHNFKPDYYKKLQILNHIQYIVNTNFIKEKIIKLGFNPSKITVLPVGLDTHFFKSDKKEHSSFNILFVGRLIELKAPLLAIKIVEKLVKENDEIIHLHLIGEGKEHNNCLNYIKKNNLNRYITLYGAKSQDEIKTIMDFSNVFLFPGIMDKTGRCEAQGLVLQEAQSMELPVVISDVGGMSEGMINKETGYVIKEGDIDGFVERLKYLKDHPEKRTQLGKKGRTFVVEHYDNLVLGQQLLNFYADNRI